MERPVPPFAIKICGLSTPQTLDAALTAGVEMIGLVFHPRSPRFVSDIQALELAAMARGRAEIVALIVDHEPDEARHLVEWLRPDWLQLHGQETPERVGAIKDATGLCVMKALGIATQHDLAAIASYQEVADRILLDAKAPKDAAYPGGHGRPFDWSILAALDPALRFMLSGGLDPANVAQAITVTRPSGVDVSSGVESAPGVKDIDRITDFVVAARAAAAAATQEAGRT
ncbi:phosphoribosylanthranilate isomerase [Bosea sp. (in: a-proteobacteria)]|uniref:phosphoribosylanthranilate isomerase n=1 Tax=Bosea sp. (in: a-proteobacteria) TaxID=1871050 RepID=UPI002733D34D|nr:phosphoribosylanthranilate isomerase [Bosea sp. (in: a-proteobacteria)]MDP3409419.1 phosphoribosylanthranilate isomerase [Bosea sp. (in: a-proteobacteria)]